MSCCRNPIWHYLGSSGALADPELLASASAPASPSPAKTTSAIDTLFVNGTFLLAEPGHPGEAVTAVAISGHTIVDVGDEARLRAEATPQTTVIDLGGETLAPGFVESHMHVVVAIQTIVATDVGVSQCKTYASVIKTIRKMAASAKPGEWRFFVNYDPSLLECAPKTGFPQLGFDAFDGITEASDVNIFVENASGHIAYGNRAAFATARITVDSDPGAGGHYGKVDGKLNGVMFESPSFLPFLRFVPQEQILKGAVPAILGLLKTSQRRGITTIADPSVGVGGDLPSELELYNTVVTHQDAKTWLVASVDITTLYGAHGAAVPGLCPPPKPGACGTYKDLVLPAVKIWGDGSTQGYTAFLREPYKPPVTPEGLGPRGAPDWTREAMADLIGQARADNWSVLIHANGDAGLDQALNAIREVYHDAPGFRKRIEHCTVTKPEQYLIMRELGVTPSYLTNHIAIWGDTFADHVLGEERAQRLDAAGDAVAHGLIFSMHCDYGTSSPDPLRYVQTAVTRQTASGRVLGPELVVTAIEALKGVTIYPAMQLGLAERIGTIAKGKDADFVHLAQDPTRVPGDAIAAIAIRGTWLKGRAIPAA